MFDPRADRMQEIRLDDNDDSDDGQGQHSMEEEDSDELSRHHHRRYDDDLENHGDGGRGRYDSEEEQEEDDDEGDGREWSGRRSDVGGSHVGGHMQRGSAAGHESWHRRDSRNEGSVHSQRESDYGLSLEGGHNEPALHHGLDISGLGISMQELGFDPRARRQPQKSEFPELASNDELAQRNRARCRCRRNVTCTFVTQYVSSMIAFFGGLSYLVLRAPLRYSKEMTTWLTLIFFTYGAGRFYMARAKQQAVAERRPAVYGQFATMEVSYFYLSNTALGGATWLSLSMCCVARLALCLVLISDEIGFSVYIYMLFCSFAAFLAIPALPIGAKCFPPRTPKHSLILKAFIVLTVITMSSAFFACQQIGDNELDEGDKEDMRIAGSSQLIYCLVLMMAPQYFPLHIAEALGMICQIMLWQATLTVMGRNLLV